MDADGAVYRTAGAGTGPPVEVDMDGSDASGDDPVYRSLDGLGATPPPPPGLQRQRAFGGGRGDSGDGVNA